MKTDWPAFAITFPAAFAMIAAFAIGSLMLAAINALLTVVMVLAHDYFHTEGLRILQIYSRFRHTGECHGK